MIIKKSFKVAREFKFIALFMIYLVISITFLSAFAMGTIYKAEMLGSNNASNVIKSTDNVIIRSVSTFPASVRLDFLNTGVNGTNNSFYQMSCGAGTPTTCVYTKQLTNVAGKISATVMEATTLNTQVVEAYVDDTAPTINSLTTSSLGNSVKATYSTTDSANIYYPGYCSGIKKVELYLNSKLVTTSNLSANNTTSNTNATNSTSTTTASSATICTVTGSLTGTIANYMGDVNVSIKAYDYIGLTANSTGAAVFIDTVSPKIKTAAKAYYPGTEDVITKISLNSTRQVTADIEVEVEDNSLPLANGVFGDFTQLDRTGGTTSEIAAVCARQGWNETYLCRFSGVTLMPVSASPKIIIRAIDSFGNNANASIGLTFTTINSAGTVTRLGPDASKCSADKCYLKAGANEITALISTSSSFNNSDVKIEGTQAECYYNSTWQCKANTAVSGALELNGYDDLGNEIHGTSTLQIIIDDKAPVRTGAVNVTPSCPTSKESLIIKMNVTEAESPTLTMKAVTSGISSNNETKASCVKQGTTSKWVCTLTVSSLIDEEKNTNLNIILEDFAGNQLKENVAVSVCVLIDEEPTLIKEVKTTGTLPKIDKKTASKLAIKVPLPLQIVLEDPDVQILQRSTVSCTGTPGLSGQAYMVNDAGLSPVLVIPLKYDESWDDENKVIVNCTQEYKLRNGNRIYTKSEKESITAELTTYNQAIGTITQAYTKKVTDIKKQIQALDAHITKYEKTYKILGAVCTLAENLGKVNTLLQAVKTALWPILIILSKIPPTATAAQAIWDFLKITIGGFQNFVDTWIWPQGWIPSGLTLGFAIKTACAVYTCKFYDFNTWAAIGIEIGVNAALKNENLITARDCNSGGCTTTYQDGSVEVTSKTDQGDIRVITSGDQKTITTIFPDGTKEVWDKTTNTRIPYDKDGNVITETKLVETPLPTAGSSTESTNPDFPYTDFTDGDKKYTFDMKGNRIYADGTVKDPTGKILKPGDPDYPSDSVLSFSYTGTPEGVGAGAGVTPTAETPVDSGKGPPVAPPAKPTPENLVGTTYVLENGREIRVKCISSTLSDGGVWIDYRGQQILLRPSTQPGRYYAAVTRSGSRTGNILDSTNNVIASDQLTGQVTGEKLTAKDIFKPFTSDQSITFDADMRTAAAIDAFLGDEGSWIYNPYKSRHYDGLCAPAIMFNDRKERQLLCKRLGCIEQMAEMGGPIEACEYDYDLGMCMYVDSARYKLEGAATFPKVVGNFFKTFFNNIAGLGTTLIYLFVLPRCVNYQHPVGFMEDVGGDILGDKSIHSVACGTLGTLMSLNEILAFFHNPYNPISTTNTEAPVDIPAGSMDFCAGVDYS